MGKTANRQVSSSSFKTLVYCVFFALIAGCAMEPATEEDVASAQLEEARISQHRDDVVVSTVPAETNPPATTIQAPVLTLPEIPLPQGLIDQCRCEWGTWSTGNGLMCAGIRCNEHCDMATRGCVERHACVPAGI